jgi:hypothetical protein
MLTTCIDFAGMEFAVDLMAGSEWSATITSADEGGEVR